MYCRGFAQDVRKVFGRKAVQPGIESALATKNHLMDDLFGVKVKEMIGKKDKTTGKKPILTKIGVSCKSKDSLDELVQFVVRHRGYNPHQVHLILRISYLTS